MSPPRQKICLFKLFEEYKVDNIEDCDFLLCTGLFEDFEKDLKFYENLFKNKVDKKLICTNPDLVVDRGEIREFCAGSVAKVFERLGGKVEYFGKPYPLVYNQAATINNKKVLCIGDNLNTDIKGANNLKYDSLLISNGIHKKEINQKGIKKVVKSYKRKINFIQRELKW